MSATAERLTFAQLAAMLKDDLRDRTYVHSTGIGQDVAAFLGYFRTERGKQPETIRSFEYTLARLALFHADKQLRDFEPPEGTQLVRDYLRFFWADCADSTWNKNVATNKSFFKWAHEEGRLVNNPATIIRYRQERGSDRRAHPAALIERIVVAQDERRDRIAVQCMGRLAFRRDELRRNQFRHWNFDTGEVTVFGKGGTVLPIAVPVDLLAQVMSEALDRSAHPDEFLLYPYKLGRRGSYPHYLDAVIWEDRRKALSLSSVDRWWARCLERAGVEHFPMHELRHSAGDTFYRATRDLKLTQLLMRHKKSATTADTYLHLDQADLAEAWRGFDPWTVEA